VAKRLKVLISAYACEPGKGSEPGVGWNVVEQMARHHTVWVITRADRRQSIEAVTKDTPLPNVEWIYYDLPLWEWRKFPKALRLHYYLWQAGAYF
jgi:hypothetical protein